MEKNARESVPIYSGDLDKAAKVMGLGDAHGYSFYHGILVIWDADFDERILTFIDNNPNIIPGLLAAHEHEGYLLLLWLEGLPGKPEQQFEVAGDCWSLEVKEASAATWLPILKDILKPQIEAPYTRKQ